MRQAIQARIVHATCVALGLVAVSVLPACTWSSNCSTREITTESLPDATVGRVYSFTLTDNCRGEAATWALLAGELPAGITLSYDGRLLGTPTGTGSFFFRVVVTFTSRVGGGNIYNSGSDSRGYTLTVRP